MEYYENLSLNNIVYFCEIDLIKKIEQWRNVIGYEGFYDVSDLGRVKSVMYKKHKMLLQYKSPRGYLNVKLSKNTVRKGFRVNRLVALNFIPNPENKPDVNHKDGIKINNTVPNLEWNTKAENNLHMFRVLKHTSKRRIFSDSDVEYIRKYTVQRKDGLHGNGNVKSICEKFKTSQSVIHNIITFKTYKNARSNR